MTVLDPGRVSIAFPEAVRSFLAEQCPKRSHGDPIQPQNNFFKKILRFGVKDFVLFGFIFDLQNLSPREPIPNHLPPGALDPFQRLRRVGGGRASPSPPPQPPPHLKFMRGFAPQTPQKRRTPEPLPKIMI